MAAYLARAKEVLSRFQRAEVQQISRESNSHTDALVSLAPVVEAESKRTVEVETLEKPRIELQPPRQLMCVDLGPSWMVPITAYLRGDQLPEDKSEVHKIRLRAARFWLSPDGKLYKKSYTAPTSSASIQVRLKTSFMKFKKESATITLEAGHWHTELSAKAIGGSTCKRTPSSTLENARSARSSHTPITSQCRI